MSARIDRFLMMEARTMRAWLGPLAGMVLIAAFPADDPKAPEGFIPLFDGKTLNGWRMVNTKDNFYVRDGRLVMNKGNGWLATEKTFADFELRLRYRFLTPGADSGVFIRSSLEGKNWTNRGYQIQNMDNETLGMVVGMGVKVKAERKPDLVKQIKKPAGEWLNLTIIAQGHHVDVLLEGQQVATSDDLTLKDGHIGLQAEGGIIEFERIDLKPLDSDRAEGSSRHSGDATAASSLSVPDSIRAEGVPAIPSAIADALNRHQNIRAASFQDWLGDQRQMLITTRFANTNQVHRVAAPGAARYQLTFFDERVLGAEARPRRDSYLFMMDDSGAENFQLFLADPRSHDIIRLSDGRSRHTAPRWSNSGRLLAYSSNARNGQDMDLYILDPTDPTAVRRLKDVSGDWHVEDWAPNDLTVAVLETISINETYVSLISVADGTTEMLTPRPAPGAPTVAFRNVRFSKDGKSLYFTTDLDSEFRRLARYDLSTKQTTPLTTPIPWDIDEFDLSDDGRTIVFVANEDGIDRLHILDIESGQERPAPKLPVGQISGLKFRRGAREFGFTLETARSTPDAYSYDLGSGQLFRWTESELGGLDPETFAEPEMIHYSSFDGREIPAFVYKPGARFKAPYPVLIDIHGGPESQFRPGFLGRLNYFLDELGIAVIFPNVRGSSGYGKSYLKLDNGLKREEAVKDIGALLDWIGKQPDLDASRVAVIGGSYGGFMSLATMTHYSDRLKAGINIVGISNFLSFLQNTQSYRRDLRRTEYGDERDATMREFLQKVSPLTSADKIKVPILVVAGQNDPRVPVSESDQIVAEVKKNGVPVWYIVGKNEGHGFAKKPNQDYLQAAEVLFLKRFLLSANH
jgi:dipeptidyl aminopeptidase/acylaminoacyl peptidase